MNAIKVSGRAGLSFASWQFQTHTVDSQATISSMITADITSI